MQQASKFIQITATQRADGSPVLYALDEAGRVWWLSSDEQEWRPGLRCANDHRRRAVSVSPPEATLKPCHRSAVSAAAACAVVRSRRTSIRHPPFLLAVQGGLRIGPPGVYPLGYILAIRSAGKTAVRVTS
jgi:hypothetical protein